MHLLNNAPDRLRRFLVSRRMQLAVKGAIAAAVAWLLAEAVTRALHGDGLDSYIYYAPFGAVVTTDVTIAGSLRIARQSALALALGALLGLGVDHAVEPSAVSLALVVAAGVLLGGLPWLGGQRGLVPIAALFVLVIGSATDAEAYATGYVALTALGAACGVVVNMLFPTVPFRQQQEAMQLLKARLSAQLVELAEGLRQQPPPAREGWLGRRHNTTATLEQTREAVRELLEAQRGNLLEASRHRIRVERQAEILAALERVAFLVEDLLVVLAQTHREDLPPSPLDPELAGVVAAALEELAALVRVFDQDVSVDDDRVRDVEACMSRLTQEFGRRRDLAASDVALLGAVVANLRRATAAVHPEAERVKAL